MNSHLPIDAPDPNRETLDRRCSTVSPVLAWGNILFLPFLLIIVAAFGWMFEGPRGPYILLSIAMGYIAVMWLVYFYVLGGRPRQARNGDKSEKAGY